MREILFRGKRVDNGEWVEGYFCRKYFSELPHNRCVIQYETECTKEWRPDYMVAEVIPKTVGQYTGLTDKNGKKIFEGDIVCWCRIKGTIVWEEHKIYIKSNLLWDFSHDDIIEVIGNIHDNPELLKGGTDNGHP